MPFSLSFAFLSLPTEENAEIIALYIQNDRPTDRPERRMDERTHFLIELNGSTLVDIAIAIAIAMLTGAYTGCVDPEVGITD